MFEKMLSKRAEVLGRAAIMRSVPGSGYHDNDPLGPVKHPDPVGRRDAEIDQHVVGFKMPFETYFLGECATRCANAVAEYTIINEHFLLDSRLDQDTRRIIETAKEYAGRPLVDGAFVIRNQQFNDVLAILHLCNLGVTTTAV